VERWLGRKHFKEIEHRTMVELASRVAALQKGDVNASKTYLQADQIEKLRKTPTSRWSPSSVFGPTSCG